MKNVLDTMAGLLIYGGGIGWLIYEIYTNGFTEPVIWVFVALGCLVFLALCFGNASMDIGGGIAFMFTACIVVALFSGALLIRLLQGIFKWIG